MKYILDHKQMEQCDKNTMEYYGVPSAVLMERASLCVAEEITARCPDPNTAVLSVCGTGNNGGDGLDAARLLHLKGYPVCILYPGNEAKASTEGKRQLDICRKYKIPVYHTIEDLLAAEPRFQPENDIPGNAKVYIDALFGIGLARPVGGVYADVIRWMNEQNGCKAAVDIPSGIDADTGLVMGEDEGVAFKADLTVTFGFAKIGQILYPGCTYAGELLVRDMGIDENSLLDIGPQVRHLEQTDIRALLPRRVARSNKGTYGRIALFAGSENMAGAAILSAKAAYAAGAGLVEVVTPHENREILQTSVPEAVLTTYNPYASPEDIRALTETVAARASVIAAGPGIGTGPAAKKIVQALLTLRTQDDLRAKPCVLDADALNIISAKPELKAQTAGCILTPHLGEMARLSGYELPHIQKHILDIALDFAKEYNNTIVLKDARTVIADGSGQAFINRTGNNGMAAGGSGDVLTGLLAALAAGTPGTDLKGTDLKGTDPKLLTAALACHIHGAAGDAVLPRTGTRSMQAGDLIRGIRAVLRDV